MSFGQNKLDRLDKSDMETSILFSAFPLIDISDYQTTTNSAYTFYQAYKTLGEKDHQNRFMSLESFKLKNSFLGVKSNKVLSIFGLG